MLVKIERVQLVGSSDSLSSLSSGNSFFSAEGIDRYMRDIIVTIHTMRNLQTSMVEDFIRGLSLQVPAVKVENQVTGEMSPTCNAAHMESSRKYTITIPSAKFVDFVSFARTQVDSRNKDCSYYVSEALKAYIDENKQASLRRSASLESLGSSQRPTR